MRTAVASLHHMHPVLCQSSFRTNKMGAQDHAECERRLAAALREASRLQTELAASEKAKRGLEVGVREVEEALTRTEQRVRRLQALLSTYG